MRTTFSNRRFILVSLILGIAFCLRVVSLSSFPPALYWEEVALGYDAFSILKTGKDHHGNWLPIVAFKSFGDWKPSLYFYSIIPFIPLFGLSLWAVRLPSVIAGTVTVFLVGKIADQLEGKNRSYLSLIAMSVTAISPWAIQFSRAGWEVNLATCLILGGIYWGFKSWEEIKNVTGIFNLSLLLSTISLVLSIYAYHSARIIAPVLGLLVIFPWIKAWLFVVRTQNIRKKLRFQVLSTGATALILCLPVLLALNSQTTNQRFAETSIFSDLEPIIQSNHLIEQDGNTHLSRIVHHRYLIFSQTVLQQFLSHFSPNFLFISGDQNPRHSVQFVGQLYYLDALFLILGAKGLLSLWKKDYKIIFLWLWLIIGIFPAAITKAAPHALRILPSMPVFILLISFGIQESLEYFSNKKWQNLIIVLLVGIYLIQFAQFWHFYSKVYPKVYASEWQDGYKQLVETINQNNQAIESIYITREYGRPAMYYWFFSQTDPQHVQQQAEIVPKDQGEFLQFDNVHFVDGLNGEEKGLIASSPNMSDKFTNKQVISEVKDLNNRTVWVIFRTVDESTE